MNIITIVAIAIGLAMDAFAASISSGIAIKNLKVNNSLKIALFFGFFQAFMPLVGWLLGIRFKYLISGVDHWIAFILLSLIGCKMIYETMKTEQTRKIINPLNIHVLLGLSIATSIDALVIGVSFALLNVSIVVPIIIIGITTFILSFTGVFIGDRLGNLFGKKIEIAGGLVLIGIGIKILLEHLL
ncbi:MAG: manganese efflux pump MntP family protein [Caldisericaceae bacterium]|nr:manganese efflux pump MntP family protein [Caldisericaceae bacterium]